MRRLVVLISNAGKGTNLEAILKAIRSKKIYANVVAVISDTKEAHGLKYAKEFNIPVKISTKKENLLSTLNKLKPDYIALAGWKQIILEEVIDAYPQKILNVHPGAIPDALESRVIAPDKSTVLWNRGMLTQKAIKNFFYKKSTYASSSIHFLTHEFDFGPVIERAFEKIKAKDTIDSLYKRLKRKEHQIYIKALRKLTNGMSVMVIDGGGRAHVLVKKYLENPKVVNIYAVPGNDLMILDGVKTFSDIKTTDIQKIVKLAKELRVDLVDVTQDDAIASGLVDVLQRNKIKVFGPTKKASQIEWDKAFARNFMQKFNLPIPKYHVFTNQSQALELIKGQKNGEWYIKASGLAAGKGAIYAKNNRAAQTAIKTMKKFGKSGETFLLEEKLTGEEFSAFAIVFGKKFQMLGYAQDHKAVFDGDKGPNTGGMGCTSTPLCITPNIKRETEEIIRKTVTGLTKLKRPYSGILYLGGMIVNGKVFIIEYNARWGEPEAQVVLPSIKNEYFNLVGQALEAKIPKIRKDNFYRVVVTAAAKGYPGDSSKVRGKEIIRFESLLKNKNVQVSGTRVNIKNGKYIAIGSRLFYVAAKGQNVKEAREKVYGALSKVRIVGGGLHYRKDIGYRDLKRV